MSRLATRLLMVFCLLLVLPQQSMAEDNGREGAGPVGAYLFSFLGLGPGLTVPGLVTLSSDGTLSSITGSDEAGPASVFFVKNSAIHGVWSRGKNGAVSARALYLNFDPASGVVVGITKLRIEAQFDKSFNNISGAFFMSVFACPTPFTCPSPFAGTPTVPEPATGLPFTAVRIQ